MKKLPAILITAAAAIVAGYLGYQYIQSSKAMSMSQAAVAEQSSQPSSSPPENSPTPTSKLGMYKDGTYTGQVANAIYGPIQVKVTVQGGKLTDIQFLQYPNSPGHTSEVSQTSLPALKSEAITAQNANVDVVSGATQTSEGFVQTLQSALAQAS